MRLIWSAARLRECDSWVFEPCSLSSNFGACYVWMIKQNDHRLIKSFINISEENALYLDYVDVIVGAKIRRRDLEKLRPNVNFDSAMFLPNRHLNRLQNACQNGDVPFSPASC